MSAYCSAFVELQTSQFMLKVSNKTLAITLPYEVSSLSHLVLRLPVEPNMPPKLAKRSLKPLRGFYKPQDSPVQLSSTSRCKERSCKMLPASIDCSLACIKKCTLVSLSFLHRGHNEWLVLFIVVKCRLRVLWRFRRQTICGDCWHGL